MILPDFHKPPLGTVWQNSEAHSGKGYPPPLDSTLVYRPWCEAGGGRVEYGDREEWNANKVERSMCAHLAPKRWRH